MNKLKLLYDVVKTLKDKAVIGGIATAQVKKDQAKIFYVKNEFQKDLVNMQSTAKITSEIDYEGKKVKHQSTTEYSTECLGHGHGMHHKLFKHMHHAGTRCCGIKAKLSKLAFVLAILNDIKVDEQADKNILVTLEMNELPAELKAIIAEKMSQTEHGKGHQSCCCMKELCNIKQGNLSLAMSVTPNYEIEKIVVTFDGVQENAEQEEHILDVVAELKLSL